MTTDYDDMTKKELIPMARQLGMKGTDAQLGRVKNGDFIKFIESKTKPEPSNGETAAGDAEPADTKPTTHTPSAIKPKPDHVPTRRKSDERNNIANLIGDGSPALRSVVQSIADEVEEFDGSILDLMDIGMQIVAMCKPSARTDPALHHATQSPHTYFGRALAVNTRRITNVVLNDTHPHTRFALMTSAASVLRALPVADVAAVVHECDVLNGSTVVS